MFEIVIIIIITRERSRQCNIQFEFPLRLQIFRINSKNIYSLVVVNRIRNTLSS